MSLQRLRSLPAAFGGGERAGREGGFHRIALARETYSPMGQAHGGPSTTILLHLAKQLPALQEIEAGEQFVPSYGIS